MNIYNVRRATAALGTYLQKTHSNASQLRVAISFDSRRFSREFAVATSEVLAAMGIEALLTKEMRPVPMLSFMVRHFGCHAGVCITASHNPPEYNGFKVYWSTGGQLVPPHDHNIIEEYEKLSRFEDIKTLDSHNAKSHKLIKEIGVELDEAYFAEAESLSLRKEGRKNFRIAYSPLHGTGLFPVTTLLNRFGFTDIHVVESQAKPDGNFPTVKSPNPEDPAAMELAVKLGQEVKADLILATDPDSDRIGIVVREGDNLTTFNGNQIGCLLTEYVMSATASAGKMPNSPLVIKTIVTTDLQRDIATHYGAHCDETLTGFKWICDQVEQYESGKLKPYRQYVCGGEESYGFLAGRFVRDKDAVAACAIAAEMTAWYKSQGLSLSQVLDSIFLRHGVYQEDLFTITLPGMAGQEKIAKIMEKFRSDPPRAILGTPVNRIRDYEQSQEFGVEGPNFSDTHKLPFPQSNVLQFILSDGSKISVRPSGTEPKIKFYVSVKNPVSSASELGSIKKLCAERALNYRQAFVAFCQ